MKGCRMERRPESGGTTMRPQAGTMPMGTAAAAHAPAAAQVRGTVLGVIDIVAAVFVIVMMATG
jgi:hypothetical protein